MQKMRLRQIQTLSLMKNVIVSRGTRLENTYITMKNVPYFQLGKPLTWKCLQKEEAEEGATAYDRTHTKPAAT
jgi:hypothetical protein